MNEFPQAIRSILLIEDHREVAEMIGEYLERQGYDVDVVFDGICGLRLAQSKHYDAIVLDVTLPGLDGLDLFKALRSTKGHMAPIVVVAEKDCVEDQASIIDAGIEDYLIKPFAFAELDARIEAVMASPFRLVKVPGKRSGRMRQTRPRTRALRGGERQGSVASTPTRGGSASAADSNPKKGHAVA